MPLLFAALTDSLALFPLIAGACAALAYLVVKVIVPTAKLITKLVETLPYLTMLPILKTLEAHFEAVEANVERDRAQAVDFAATNRAAIVELQAGIGTLKELSRETRDQVVEVLRSGARTEASGMRMEASGARTEASGVRTEASGARTEAADAVVAGDLAKSQKRADEVHEDAEAGVAADAASQSPD